MKKNHDKVELCLRIVCIVSSILFVAGIVIDCLFSNEKAYEQYSSLTQNITGLCANLAVSYLFFIIAFLPEKRKERSVNRVVDYYMGKLHVEYKEIVDICDGINNDRISLDDSPNKRTIVQSDNSRVFMTYYQHFVNFYNRSTELRGELLPFSDYLNDSLRNLLYDYINSGIFRNIKSMLIDNPSDAQKNLFITSIHSMFLELKSIGDNLFATRS